MYAGMSHKLNHLLPFKTLMKKITINAAFLWGDYITNVILFKEILLKLYRPVSKWFSVYFPWFNVVSTKGGFRPLKVDTSIDEDIECQS